MENNICTVLTSDAKTYKIPVEILIKHSTFFQVMLQDGATDSLQLSHISSSAFDYVYEFLQLHKVHPPKQLSKPILRKVKLSQIMMEQDAQLMQRILGLESELQLEIMNCVMYLQMDSFKKILTYALIQKQLQEPLHKVKMSEEVEAEIRKQIGERINSLIQMEEHKKRLQNEVFEEIYPGNE